MLNVKILSINVTIVLSLFTLLYFDSRCLWRVPVRAKWYHHITVIPRLVPSVQELSVGDRGATAAQDHAQLHALRLGRKQYVPTGNFKDHCRFRNNVS